MAFMTFNAQTIAWPVLLKYQGDDELLYLDNHAQWEANGLSRAHFQPDDQLIDVFGNIYLLNHREHQMLQPIKTGEQLTLKALNGLVKAHAAQIGQCCIEKILLSSFDEAMRAVATMQETHAPSTGVVDSNE